MQNIWSCKKGIAERLRSGRLIKMKNANDKASHHMSIPEPRTLIVAEKEVSDQSTLKARMMTATTGSRPEFSTEMTPRATR